VGVSNKKGSLVVSKYRNDSKSPIKPRNGHVDNIINLREWTREQILHQGLAKPIYSFTLYEKVKRVTIALENKDYPILMVSFDIRQSWTYCHEQNTPSYQERAPIEIQRD
jgi:hypothetical protein